MLVVHYEHFNFLSNITSRLFIHSIVESSLIPLLQVTVELASFFHIHTASRNSRKRGIFHIRSPAGSLILSPYTLPYVAPRWIHRIDQSSGYYFRQFAPCKVVARIIYYVFSMYCGYNSLTEIHDRKRNSRSTDSAQKVYIMHSSRSCTFRNL